jgi:hypothetical protein
MERIWLGHEGDVGEGILYVALGCGIGCRKCCATIRNVYRMHKLTHGRDIFSQESTWSCLRRAHGLHYCGFASLVGSSAHER